MKTMKTLSAILLALVIMTVSVAFAATPSPSPASTGYSPMVIPIMGMYSTSRPAVVKWKAPSGYQLVHASATARASGGTNPTLTVNMKQASTALFTAPVAVTAGTITDAVLTAAPKIPDESTVSIDLAITGTSPVWREITVFVLLKRL